MPASKETRSAAATTHGQSKSPEYAVWNSMRERCGNENHKSYQSYGGRGIRVCERWEQFENFIADIGPRPSRFHSIDRHPNNNGNYEPGNVRWATAREQTNNRRSCRMIVFNGKRQSVSDAARQAGLPYFTVSLRLRKGWSVEKTFGTPVRGKGANGTHPRAKRLDSPSPFEVEQEAVAKIMESMS